jgi:hypothetical protein
MAPLHLASLADRQRTLCGLRLSEVSIGSYYEYLDATDDQEPMRMIWGPDGRKATACPTCLERQPSALAMDKAPLEICIRVLHPFRVGAASGIEVNPLTPGYRAHARYNSLALKPDGTARVSLSIAVTTNVQTLPPSPIEGDCRESMPVRAGRSSLSTPRRPSKSSREAPWPRLKKPQ